MEVRRCRRLNKRGKIAVSILLAIIFFSFYGIFNGDDKEVEGNIASSFELSFSSEPAVTFADSTLSQSIIETENEKRETARKEAFKKQNMMDQQERAVYLTFDDGPTQHTERLLDILNEYQMKATFFMLGRKMKEYPSVVRRIKREGFGLALHSMTHDIHTLYQNAFSPTEEMIETQNILEEITGVHSTIVRLPYGSIPYLTEEMRYVLNQHSFNVWDWNVDSMDWELKDNRYVQHTIQKLQELEQAGVTPVVLLHDKKETIDHLPSLLAYIKQEGYQTKVLTDDLPPLTFQCEGNCYSISALAKEES